MRPTNYQALSPQLFPKLSLSHALSPPLPSPQSVTPHQSVNPTPRAKSQFVPPLDPFELDPCAFDLDPILPLKHAHILKRLPLANEFALEALPLYASRVCSILTQEAYETAQGFGDSVRLNRRATQSLPTQCVTQSQLRPAVDFLLPQLFIRVSSCDDEREVGGGGGVGGGR